MGFLRSLRRSMHRINKSGRSRQVGGSCCGCGAAGHEGVGHNAAPVVGGTKRRRRRRSRQVGGSGCGGHNIESYVAQNAALVGGARRRRRRRTRKH